MSSCKSVFSAFPRHFAYAPAGLALVIGASAAIASARQTTDFVSLTPQGTLPLTGASGSVASFGLCADGSVIAFHSFASDVVPGASSGTGHTYVRDRRRATTVLASVGIGGVEGNGQSIPMDVSWSGRWIMFRSQASNLDALDGNTADDVFVRDLETQTTSIVSLGTNGSAGNSAAGYFGGISGDARFVAFETWASNWAVGDTNGVRDVFHRDRAANTTTLVSVSLAGGVGNGESFATHMSDNGRFVVFSSKASNLVDGDVNGKRDCFLRDVSGGATLLVSIGSTASANGDSNLPEVSNDGRFVAFESAASNLVAGDTNGVTDVFVRDMTARVTQRVSLGIGGVELNHMSTHAGLSADGNFVGFVSRGTNHGFGDSNGYETDVFLADRAAGTLQRASQDSGGAQANQGCAGLRVSAEGRSLVFASYAWNLGPFLDTNNYVDAFVHDAFASHVQAYCSAKTSSNGCVAAMRGEGAASVSAAAPFPVRATNVDNQKSGLVLFGFAPASIPFQGGTMCIAPPRVRTAIQPSGGDPAPVANCTGALAIDFNALIQAGSSPQLVTGALVFCQAWFRDPPGLFHSALSNGLRFPILP